MQIRVDESEKNLKAECLTINKGVNDLEAHINTSIITEKSVRKA